MSDWHTILNDINAGNHRWYPYAEMTRARDKIAEQIAKERAFVMLDNRDTEIAMDRVAGVITEVELVTPGFRANSFIQVKIKFIDSPMGKLAQALPADCIRFSAVGHGLVGDGGRVYEYDYKYTDAHAR